MNDAGEVIERKLAKESILLLIFLGISIFGVIANAFYAAHKPFLGLENDIELIRIVSTFTDAAIGLFIATKILLIYSSFYKAIGVSIVFALLTMLIKALGSSIIFFGLLIVVGATIFLMKIFNIGFLKVLGIIVIQTLCVLVFELAVLGLHKILI